MLFASIFSPKTKEKTVFGFLRAVGGILIPTLSRPNVDGNIAEKKQPTGHSRGLCK